MVFICNNLYDLKLEYNRTILETYCHLDRVGWPILVLHIFFENCYSAMTLRKTTTVMVQWLKSCGKLLCVYKQLIYISMLCLPAMSYTRHVAMCSFSLILLHIITLAKYFCYSVLWYCVSHAMMNHVKLCVSWVDMCVCVQLSSIIYLCMYVYI